MNNVKLIWAQSINGVIGNNGKLPFRVPEDLARFKQLTTGNIVLMGRKTWDSLPRAFKPLPGRYNVILTNDKTFQPMEHQDVEVANDLEKFLQLHHDKEIWVIGGGELYAQTLRYAKEIYVTQVLKSITGDTHAPAIDEVSGFTCKSATAVAYSNENQTPYRFEHYVRKRILRYAKKT